MTEEPELVRVAADERAPICPACGVTQNLVGEDEGARFVCLECGFSDDQPS